MRTTLFVLIAIFGIVLPTTGLATELDLKAIASKPAAHNPQFDNEEAWPDLVGDEYFLKEKWPEARLLIWNLPEPDEKGRRPKGDAGKLENWINAETGKPAKSLPDMDTDIILPDSDKPYKVFGRGQQKLACRHLTVGRNVTFEPRLCLINAQSADNQEQRPAWGRPDPGRRHGCDDRN